MDLYRCLNLKTMLSVHVHTGFAVMEHRVRRNRIPIEHRERIVRAFEDHREKRRNVNTIIARKCAAWFTLTYTTMFEWGVD